MLLWLKCIYVRVFYLTNFVHVRFRWFEKLPVKGLSTSWVTPLPLEARKKMAHALRLRSNYRRKRMKSEFFDPVEPISDHGMTV